MDNGRIQSRSLPENLIAGLRVLPGAIGAFLKTWHQPGAGAIAIKCLHGPAAGRIRHRLSHRVRLFD